jgi:hypothetical protein
MALGQLPENPGSTFLRIAQLVARLPIILLTIVAAGLFSWLAFWFLVRLSFAIYERFLNHRW